MKYHRSNDHSLKSLSPPGAYKSMRSRTGIRDNRYPAFSLPGDPGVFAGMILRVGIIGLIIGKFTRKNLQP